MSGFFAELQRRKVYRVAVAYIVAAGFIIQIASAVFPAWELPNWVLRVVVVLLLVGFPIALILAWAYDVTPRGVESTPNTSAGTYRRRNLITLVAAGVVVSAAAGFFLLPRASARKIDKSIAVLPFENLSADASNAYFADGIQDEIITRLANVGDLKVISRNSTQRYKINPENLKEVARQLGVGHFLEGSVQKAGDRVRINVQLIRAGANDHLWAQIYDRQLTDIFAVESELANAIANALRAKLTGAERNVVAQEPTKNLEAYDAYLKGINLLDRPGPRSQVFGAVESLNEAVRLDPKFALAWAKLAEANAAIYFKQFETTAERKEAARVAVETATKLQPDAPATVLANGFYRYHVLRDYDGARVLFEKVRREVPSNSDAPRALALVARRQGRWTEALQLFDQAVQLNPRDADLLAEWSWTLVTTRQFPAAREIIDRALNVRPNNAELLAQKANIYQAEGDLPAARSTIEKIDIGSMNEPALMSRMSQLMLERKYHDAIAFIEKILATPSAKQIFPSSVIRLWLARAQNLAGDKSGAQASCAQARDELEKFVREQPNNIWIVAGLANAYAGVGDKAAALREGERSLAILSVAEDPVEAPAIEAFFALTEAQVGESDRAIARLERLLTIPYGPYPVTLAILRLDPAWDPLRDNPRFQKLVSGPEPKTMYK